jgi:hypothetical protein
MKSEKDAPMVQQANGLYNSADVVNSMQNNQTIGQPMPQPQVTQNQQVSQYQPPVVNQSQGTITQNANYPNQQAQINNQNNTNSNL